jgi:hypothetical protein
VFDIVRPKGDVPSIATPRPGLTFHRLFQLWLSCISGPYKADRVLTMENPAPWNSAGERVKDIQSAGDDSDTSPPPQPQPSVVIGGETSIAAKASVVATPLMDYKLS